MWCLVLGTEESVKENYKLLKRESYNDLQKNITKKHINNETICDMSQLEKIEEFLRADIAVVRTIKKEMKKEGRKKDASKKIVKN